MMYELRKVKLFDITVDGSPSKRQRSCMYYNLRFECTLCHYDCLANVKWVKVRWPRNARYSAANVVSNFHKQGSQLWRTCIYRPCKMIARFPALYLNYTITLNQV